MAHGPCNVKNHFGWYADGGVRGDVTQMQFEMTK